MWDINAMNRPVPYNPFQPKVSPYQTRKLLHIDRNGNRIYREKMINGDILLVAYNAEGEIVQDSDALYLIRKAKLQEPSKKYKKTHDV